jgi:hypothetical protein
MLSCLLQEPGRDLPVMTMTAAVTAERKKPSKSNGK